MLRARLFAGEIEIPQKTPFVHQSMDTGQESLQAVEVGGSFRCDQLLFALLTCVMPLLCNPRRAGSCVGCVDLAKPCSFNEAFVFSRWTVDVKADRTAGRNFLVSQHSADYQSVTEQHPPARFQYAKDFAQHIGAIRNMAQNVIREYGVKAF